jgi:hypothetical protein
MNGLTALEADFGRSEVCRVPMRREVYTRARESGGRPAQPNVDFGEIATGTKSLLGEEEEEQEGVVSDKRMINLVHCTLSR